LEIFMESAVIVGVLAFCLIPVIVIIAVGWKNV
jgi:hypothetical protein